MGLLLLMVTVAAPGLATAAAVSLSGGGDGRFIIRGEGLERVGGIDLTVQYDPATLANPRVSSGDLVRGALLADNTAVPGSVRIAILQSRGGISGSGTIATIAFDFVSAGAGATLQAQLVDMRGKKLAAAVSSFTPPNSYLPAQDGSTATTTAGAVRNPGWPGSVTVPGGNDSGEGRKPVDEASLQKPVVGAAEMPPVTQERAPADEQKSEVPGPAAVTTPPKLIYHAGIADRFKEFHGDMTPMALTALFTDFPVKGFRQHPTVMVADGKSMVNLTVCSELTGPGTPNFALIGAKLANLKKDEDCFSLDVVPEKTWDEVSVKVVSATAVHHIPLTVAPAMEDGSGVPLTERDFVLFLRGEGRYAALLKDREEPYRRNFIFTANYLAGKKKPAPREPQRPVAP